MTELSSDAAVLTLFHHRAERGMVGAEEKEREGEESEEITGWALGPCLQRPHLARGGVSCVMWTAHCCPTEFVDIQLSGSWLWSTPAALFSVFALQLSWQPSWFIKHARSGEMGGRVEGVSEGAGKEGQWRRKTYPLQGRIGVGGMCNKYKEAARPVSAHYPQTDVLFCQMRLSATPPPHKTPPVTRN